MNRSARLLAALFLCAAAAPLAAQSSSFGNSVVIGQDELIIGEPNNNFRPGLVYVYRRAGTTWREAARLTAPQSQRADGFGAVLAATGNTLFVAQRGGSLHMFRREGTTWRSAGTLSAQGITGAPNSCNQYGYCGVNFGLALAASGDWLLVGEPGEAADGGRRGGGPPQAQAAGVVHLFRRGADGNWTQQGRLQPQESAPGDGFGASIALVEGRALIGAPTRDATLEPPPAGRGGGAGQQAAAAPAAAPSTVSRAGRVYEFVLEGGSWRESGVLGSRPGLNAAFGTSIALVGDVAAIGAPGAEDGHGSAYIYRRDEATGAWSEVSRLAAYNSVRGDRFGTAVAIDGNDVWVGAPSPRDVAAGKVYVHRGGAAGPGSDAARRIALTETVTRDAFGERIVTRNGLAVVTATGMHHGAGSVHLYERDRAGDWQDRGRLVSAPDAIPALTGEQRNCANGKVGPFDCSEVDLLAFIPNSMLRAGDNARGVRTNDNWGWTDPVTGKEYALIGRNDGTSFIDITDPTKPVLIGDLPKTPSTPPSQLWRDMKTYKDHVFIVADGAGQHGMQVFDLRKLRNVRQPPAVFQPDVHYTRVASVHNIAINEETGFAYLVGAGDGGESCGGGLHMVDIRDPRDPKFAGCFRDERGTHDVQCLVYRGPDQRYRDRELCLKSNGSMFAISDVTDKQNVKALSRASSPNAAYIHQGWVTPDHKYFYQDDESDVLRGNVPTTRTLIWDLSDVEDPQLVKEFMGSMPASAHNQYVHGGFAYQANYRYGLHVLDLKDPVNPREVGHFDTSPFMEGPGFSGAWSTYPFFKSGTVLVTSLQEGAFLLKPRVRPVVF